jgi:hypothetical protein
LPQQRGIGLGLQTPAFPVSDFTIA